MKTFASLLLMKGRRYGGPAIAKVLGRTDMSIYVDRAMEV
jgi:hypothetical protein